MADSSRRYSYLEHLSVDRLEELLDLAVNTDEEEKTEYVDAILEVIVRKEKESPTGRLTDVDKAWADFQTYYNTEDGRGQTLHFTEEPKDFAETKPAKNRTLRKVWKTVLLVATIAICLLFSMVAAQAAGFDILGALARWTDDVFTFGTVQPKTIDLPSSEAVDAHKEESVENTPSFKISEKLPYSSFQEALDAYSVTEVSEPSQLPNGYVLDEVCGLDGAQLHLEAVYVNEMNYLSISLVSHNGMPSTQVEKTAEPVETFKVGNTTFYLMKNTDNYAVIWLTEHYECLIMASLSIERDALKNIVCSMVD